MEVWILTFNRPDALNRLVEHFGEQGQKVNVFSNYPEIVLDKTLREAYMDSFIINTLNSKESNSWCARSWNTILMKAFDKSNVDEAILIQDDTDIGSNFMEWINEAKQSYDFIWGPAGDQFHFLRKKVLQRVGWWDERYIGCYCGDADYVKRVYHDYRTDNSDRVSVVDTHNWGFNHNDCGLTDHVITTYNSKTIGQYENQHWQFGRFHQTGDEVNPTILHSQQHFMSKWGVPLDNNRPVIESNTRMMSEIDWYPWFSKKHNFALRQDFKV